jgi:NADH:ubiquinone reductase (H+-translocating)
LSPADIASPIRAILRDQDNATVILSEVEGIDTVRREVIAERRRIPYDILVVATGAQHPYFGHDEWAQHAPGLKTLDDATAIRRQILLAFERAEIAVDPSERRKLLTFVVVGGGPTGVELAGAIAELARRALAADFRLIDTRQTRIVLVEAGPRILPPFDEISSQRATRYLEQLGVEVVCDEAVTACAEDHVMLGDERIDARTILWAAGVQASPISRWLGVETDKAGRVPVGPDLSVKGHDDIFVLGDAAVVEGEDGKLLPGVAAVAKQQGEYLAEALAARARGEAVPPFRYRDYGSLATVGRGRAIAEIGDRKLSGRLAWLVWSVVHIYFLIGFRRRLLVSLKWFWSHLTSARGTRLITGGGPGVRGRGAERYDDGIEARLDPTRERRAKPLLSAGERN